jgi:hypothetical protein
MEYMVVDTGKLYHHKIRLDSVLRKPKINREDVLNYVKTKPHLYFANAKLKDPQLYKFIDKILYRKGVATQPPATNNQPAQEEQPGNGDFDYLNDE